MTSLVSRTFTSTPGRDAMATWTAIVDLLTKGRSTSARNELLAVSGVAASVIADHAPKDHAIVVTCDGPRTRIYCIYDDDADLNLLQGKTVAKNVDTGTALVTSANASKFG